MQYEAFYVIRSKQVLREIINDEEMRVLCCEPCIWCNMQGGCGVDRTAECQVSLKCLFVAQIRQFVRKLGFHEHELANMPLDEAAFDRWWTVDVFHGVDEFAGDVLKELEQESAFSPSERDILSSLKSRIRSANSTR